jgi:hypothetical protein
MIIIVLIHMMQKLSLLEENDSKKIGTRAPKGHNGHLLLH